VNTITPCLWFDDRAEEAAQFYTSLFDDSHIDEISRYGEGGPKPAGTALTVAFTLQGRPFTALNGGPEFTFNEAVSFQIGCVDQDEVDRYWSALLDSGGEEGQCGWIKDRFGVWWQVVPNEMLAILGDPDPDRAKRAMNAMFAMKKLDVAALRRAADDA
jgi:predicted 3-demethylubiquinone-9 3-methyltransferase (glyoxalase superfamily)